MGQLIDFQKALIDFSAFFPLCDCEVTKLWAACNTFYKKGALRYDINWTELDLL